MAPADGGQGAARLRERGHDLAVCVRGRALEVELHVIAGACPIARPAGPAPWRGRVRAGEVELVGFFAAGAAGRLTHHEQRTHLHVVAGDVMGHLDAAALADAVPFLPARCGLPDFALRPARLRAAACRARAAGRRALSSSGVEAMHALHPMLTRASAIPAARRARPTPP